MTPQDFIQDGELYTQFFPGETDVPGLIQRLIDQSQETTPERIEADVYRRAYETSAALFATQFKSISIPGQIGITNSSEARAEMQRRATAWASELNARGGVSAPTRSRIRTSTVAVRPS